MRRTTRLYRAMHADLKFKFQLQPVYIRNRFPLDFDLDHRPGAVAVVALFGQQSTRLVEALLVSMSNCRRHFVDGLHWAAKNVVVDASAPLWAFEFDTLHRHCFANDSVQVIWDRCSF